MNHFTQEEQSSLLNDLRAISSKIDPYNPSKDRGSLIVEGLVIIDRLTKLRRYYNHDDLIRAVMDWKAHMFPFTTSEDDARIAALIVKMPRSQAQNIALYDLGTLAVRQGILAARCG